MAGDEDLPLPVWSSVAPWAESPALAISDSDSGLKSEGGFLSCGSSSIEAESNPCATEAACQSASAPRVASHEKATLAKQALLLMK